MALKQFAVALSLAAAASPVAASRHEPATPAPAGSPETKYCMHIEAITGSRLEKVKCWTRAEWAERGVDVDQDWAKEGVTTIG
jgi:hypothetical protein